MNAATSTATMNAAEAMTSRRPVIAASVLARLVYGLDSVTTMPQSCMAFTWAVPALAGAIAGSRARPRPGSASRGRSKPRSASGFGTGVPSVSKEARPNRTLTSAWATVLAVSASSPSPMRAASTAGLSRGWPSTTATTAAVPTASMMNRSRIAAVAVAWACRLCSSWIRK